MHALRLALGQGTRCLLRLLGAGRTTAAASLPDMSGSIVLFFAWEKLCCWTLGHGRGCIVHGLSHETSVCGWVGSARLAVDSESQVSSLSAWQFSWRSRIAGRGRPEVGILSQTAGSGALLFFCRGCVSLRDKRRALSRLEHGRDEHGLLRSMKGLYG
ncbi:hypothetical protein K461DRAFT_165110 [Myriangium duriaei CBS 260.36]|uniref:Uncharacterized protein n=1 Tax=Myriangium duriaei CBS 260.36 TaxID=1168546 RepID=A0A9P4IY30_9PEZI|nr:hypothetical protein K461DRAFT_165110 [Myriangium duriaei CBS 260.36]